MFFEAKRLETHVEVDFAFRGGWLVVLCLDSQDAAKQSDRSSEGHPGFASGHRLGTYRIAEDTDGKFGNYELYRIKRPGNRGPKIAVTLGRALRKPVISWDSRLSRAGISRDLVAIPPSVTKIAIAQEATKVATGGSPGLDHHGLTPNAIYFVINQSKSISNFEQGMSKSQGIRTTLRHSTFLIRYSTFKTA